MKQLVLVLLKAYKAAISPWLPPSCRYHPTCSEYMYEAVQVWGVWKGVGLGVGRLLRCHPWSRGGYDPVPLPGGARDNA